MPPPPPPLLNVPFNLKNKRNRRWLSFPEAARRPAAGAEEPQSGRGGEKIEKLKGGESVGKEEGRGGGEVRGGRS